MKIHNENIRYDPFYNSGNSLGIKSDNLLFLFPLIRHMSIDNDSYLQAARKAIDELDLSMVANNMVIKQGWLTSEAYEASILYKNFLFLQCKYHDENLAPSEDIDEFWHNHILDTKKYKLDCEKIFGRYLDHYPYFGIDGLTTMGDLNTSFARTQELHAVEFGYPITSVRFTKFCRLIRRFLGEK